MLGQPVGGADDVESLLGGAELVGGVVNFLTTGLFDCFGCSGLRTGLSIGS